MKGTGKIWIFYDSVTQRQTKPMPTLQAQMTLLNLKVKDPQRYFLWTPGWTEWVPLPRFLESDQTTFVVAPVPSPGSMPPQKPSKPAMDEEKTVRMNRADMEDTVTHVMHPDFSQEEADPMYTEILPTSAPNKKTDPTGYYHADFSAENIDPEARHSVDIKLPRNQKKDDGANRRTSERHEFKIEVILLNKNGRTFRSQSQNISLGGTLLADELPKDFINTRFDLIIVNKFEKDPAKGRLHFQGKVVGDYTDPRRLMFIDTDEHTLKRLETLLRSYVEQQKAMIKKRRSAS